MTTTLLVATYTMWVWYYPRRGMGAGPSKLCDEGRMHGRD